MIQLKVDHKDYTVHARPDTPLLWAAGTPARDARSRR